MEKFIRAVFGLNAAYQALAGLVCLFLPVLAIELYHAPAGETLNYFLRGAFRMTGAAILLGALVSAFIARDPSRHPILPWLMGFLAVTTLVAECLMLTTGEANLSQLGLDMVAQLLILAAVAGWSWDRRPAAAGAPAAHVAG